MSIKYFCFIILFGLMQSSCVENDWIVLFNGETMNGWKPSENKSSWQIENGVPCFAKTEIEGSVFEPEIAAKDTVLAEKVDWHQAINEYSHLLGA